MSPRFSPATTVAMPARRTPAPTSRFTAKPRFMSTADDPLAALQLEVLAKTKAARLTGHGKPLGGVPAFGERRAPARRAAYRTPPR